MSKKALIIVDVQPGFCEGGNLAVEGGNKIAKKINSFVKQYGNQYDFVATTQDWHIEPGNHFSDNPDFIDSWPSHCVAGTEEAQLHKEIAELKVDCHVKKGMYSAAYSGFEGEDEQGNLLEDILRENEIDSIDVVGIAQSHCVKDTAIDGNKKGFKTRVFSDLTVPVTKELGEIASVQLDEEGIEQVDSVEVF